MLRHWLWMGGVCAVIGACSSAGGAGGADARTGGSAGPAQAAAPQDTDGGGGGADRSGEDVDAGPKAEPTQAAWPTPWPPFESSLPPLPAGEPFQVEPETWSWVDVPEAKCMGDDPTGMYVNLGRSDRLVILMEGGGACYNSTTCTLSLAIHPFGAGAVDTRAIAGVYGNNIFDRSNENNPLRDWSYVFFPYCSGDVFAGGARQADGFEGRTQQGYYNVRAYLSRLVASFPDMKKVLLTGVSAGGFGAAFNYDQVQEGFGQGVQVYMIDDSGPPLPPAQMTPCLQERWREAWRLDDIMPPAELCPGCRDPHGNVGVMGMIEYLASKYPGRRMGVVSSDQDVVIREFFGFGLDECAALDPALDLPAPAAPLSGEAYEQGLKGLFDYAEAQPGAAMRGFIVNDAQMHTWLLQPEAFGGVEQDGVALSDWIRWMVEDDPRWDHVGI